MGPTTETIINQETWHKLLSLESFDITQKWFKQIHSRELNARRTKEINAAMKQAHEYFRNASNSSYTVRPLLTFYGVTSLSRVLILLLKTNGGEEGLTVGHGLETVGWGNIMSGDIATGLKRLSELKIRTKAGLFSDFVTYTKNRISIHVRTAGVDWTVWYDLPQHGDEFSVADLFSRIPDLEKDYSNISDTIRYVPVSEMSYTNDEGIQVKVSKKSSFEFKNIYQELGYTVTCDKDYYIITSDTKTFKKEIPLFIHSYMDKAFGLFPVLFLAEPFPNRTRYSQLSIMYMVSYILGMLVRYYPTHWISLVQGEKGDSMWPTINRAQQLVEQFYPELVSTMIDDVIKNQNP